MSAKNSLLGSEASFGGETLKFNASAMGALDSEALEALIGEGCAATAFSYGHATSHIAEAAMGISPSSPAAPGNPPERSPRHITACPALPSVRLPPQRNTLQHSRTKTATPRNTPLLRTPQAPLSPSAGLILSSGGLPPLDAAPLTNFGFFPHSPNSDTNVETTPSPLFAPRPTANLDEVKMLAANAAANLDVTSLIKRSKRKAANAGHGASVVETTVDSSVEANQLSHRQLLESVMFMNSSNTGHPDPQSAGLPDVNFVSSAPGELFTRLLQQGAEPTGGNALGGTTGPGTTEEEDLALLVTTLTAISKSFEQHPASAFPSATGGESASRIVTAAGTTRDDIADQPMALMEAKDTHTDTVTRRHLSQIRQTSPHRSDGPSCSPVTTHHKHPHSDIYHPTGSLESVDQPCNWMPSTMTLPHGPGAHGASNTSSSCSARNCAAAVTFGSAGLHPVDTFGQTSGVNGGGMAYTPVPPQSHVIAHQQQLFLQSIIGPAAAAAILQPQLSPTAAMASSHPSQVAPPASAFPPMWPPSEEDYLTVNGLSLRAWRSYLLNLACCTDTETLYARLSFGLANDLAQGRMPGYHSASATNQQPHQHPSVGHPAPTHQRTVSWNVPPPPGNGLGQLGGQPVSAISQRPSINSSVNAPSFNTHTLQQPPQSQPATSAAAQQFPFASAAATGGTGGITSPTGPQLQLNGGNVAGRIFNHLPSNNSVTTGGGQVNSQQQSSQTSNPPSQIGNSSQQLSARGGNQSGGERPPPSEGRFRQIARCKSTPEYLLYISRVPKHARCPDDPHTPRVAGTTWREFSTDVRVWKKALHRKKEAIEAEDAARGGATTGLAPPGDDSSHGMYGPAVDLLPNAIKMFGSGFGSTAAGSSGLVPPPPAETIPGGTLM